MNSTISLLPYIIYTDGSSRRIGDTPLGGWAYIILQDNKIIRSDSGGVAGATNQQMELQAAINALDFIKYHRERNEKVHIYSDSSYLINCYTQQWYKKWMKNGWVNSKEEPVQNQDLWWELIPFFENANFLFFHVAGHNGNLWNEKVDKMAQNESRKLKINWRGIENGN